MIAQQFDLFSERAASAEHRSPRSMSRQEALAPASLDGAALIEAIPDAGIANAPEFAAEARRRRLFAAVKALAMIGDPRRANRWCSSSLRVLFRVRVLSRQSRLPCTWMLSGCRRLCPRPPRPARGARSHHPAAARAAVRKVIEAISAVADEEYIILLSGTDRAMPDLADAAREALEGTDHPRAA
jgi:hypothetical protein